MKRIPRPQGVTYLSLQFQEQGSDQSKQNLIKHIVTLYALKGFTWNGKPTNLYQIASLLQVSPTTVMDVISDLGSSLGNLASPENIENTIKSIITLSTTWALEDRGHIQHQLQNLLQSQGPKHKPFVTTEVNKTLKLMLDANKNLMDSYKTFFTSTNNVTNILNVIKPQDQNSLTPDEALKMLESKDKELPEASNRPVPETLADELYRKHRLESKVSVFAGPLAAKAQEPQDLPARSLKGQQSALERRGYDIQDVDGLPTD